MFNKEEKKTVISMDMGGAIEPVELPKEEEKVEEQVVERSTVVPQLMQIGETKEDVPQVMENPTEVATEKPLPKPVPTIGEVPPITQPVKEEPKVEVKEEVKVETPSVEEKVEVAEEVPLPKPTPTIGEVPTTKPITEEPKVEVKEEVKVEPEIKPEPKIMPTPTINPLEEKEESTVNSEPSKDDLEKTMVVPTINDQAIYDKQKEEREEQKRKEEAGIKEEKVEAGPNVIAEPLATEDTKKEKKKDPHFFECPPEAMPVSPMGYIMLNIIYMIPIIGLIVILAHSASYKNLNRRNYARSWLIGIILFALIIFVLVYFFKVDILGFIENLIGYKIDIQHFKFTKFK